MQLQLVTVLDSKPLDSSGKFQEGLTYPSIPTPQTSPGAIALSRSLIFAIPRDILMDCPYCLCCPIVGLFTNPSALVFCIYINKKIVDKEIIELPGLLLYFVDAANLNEYYRW
jgi:hypothetical protein